MYKDMIPFLKVLRTNLKDECNELTRKGLASVIF